MKNFVIVELPCCRFKCLTAYSSIKCHNAEFNPQMQDCIIFVYIRAFEGDLESVIIGRTDLTNISCR